MSANHDPLWKQIWKTEGIRWLGPRGDGSIDAMERFQHGFELGAREGASEFLALAKDLAEAGTAIVSELRRDKIPSPFVIGLFLEAAKAYDRVSDRMSEEGGGL